ncbi:hypothetical protein TRICI_002594 [Trichomonascus ciferrii]|uniref:Uncharacterized protein n=1 Tax=Trichomonascus ciferrii TaxID=44093 RepID=A0A642V697_9ASCO|nr:hypothetical protein TRICI_002594 [Trichomonascus ciferrii]
MSTQTTTTQPADVLSLASPTLVLLSPTLVQQPKATEAVMGRFKDVEVFHHQVLDRVTTGAIQLNDNYYSHIYVASPSEDDKVELAEDDYETLFKALSPGGVVDGRLELSNTLGPLLAGFVLTQDGSSISKPTEKPVAAQTLKKKTSAVPLKRGSTALPQFKRLAELNLNDEDEDDEELIDENDLMADDVVAQNKIVLPKKCDPGPGKKRRKACKDCTCGMKDLEQEGVEKQHAAQSQVVTLSNDDTAEVDFTVPGKKTGSCGSCALGDAFRCDGCPYIGLPPFKPGEVVSISALGGDDL